LGIIKIHLCIIKIKLCEKGRGGGWEEKWEEREERKEREGRGKGSGCVPLNFP